LIKDHAVVEYVLTVYIDTFMSLARFMYLSKIK
jgi:hypothetical protein